MNWIDRQLAFAVHARMVAMHGGAPEIRAEPALLAGLHRAQNLHAYGDPKPDIADLAAVYAGGVILNHPFMDGNKRTGFVLAALFIRMNGYDFTALEAEAAVWTLQFAARACSESEYAAWLRSHTKKKSKPRKKSA